VYVLVVDVDGGGTTETLDPSSGGREYVHALSSLGA
jgi:hypothetical protein